MIALKYPGMSPSKFPSEQLNGWQGYGPSVVRLEYTAGFIIKHFHNLG
jgi:hypothetical protein